MKIRDFQSEILLPQPIDRVFAFFSDPANLDTITPPWLSFRTLTPTPIEMREGTLIDYRLRVRGIPMRWRSRIAAWDPPHRFVDEQVTGPYSMWVHEHAFEPKDGGTLVRDRVRYATPLDFLLHRFVVGPDVSRIFAWRGQALGRIFGESRPSS